VDGEFNKDMQISKEIQKSWSGFQSGLKMSIRPSGCWR
jgi:hypothetical protein